MELTIFTDGACQNNGKKNPIGGCGVYFDNDSIDDISISFNIGNITNQRTELYACIIGLEKVLNYSKVTIYTDSIYVKECMSNWIKVWLENDWKTANKKPVKNQDLIKKLYELTQKIDVKFIHVRAHQNEPSDKESLTYYLWHGNDKADKLAVLGCEKK